MRTNTLAFRFGERLQMERENTIREDEIDERFHVNLNYFSIKRHASFSSPGLVSAGL